MLPAFLTFFITHILNINTYIGTRITIQVQMKNFVNISYSEKNNEFQKL